MGDKRKSIQIQQQATVSSKKLKVTNFDICFICKKTKKTDPLIKKSKNITNLLDKIGERASYKIVEYLMLQSEIDLLEESDKENIVYHRNCYSRATHSTHIKREKDRYSKHENQQQTSQTPDVRKSTDSTRFTRKNTTPFKKKLCFFCQSDCSNQDLHEVLCTETGEKIRESVLNSSNEELKVRLNTSINSSDARAIDIKYHLPCYVKNVQRSCVKNCSLSSTDELLKKSADIETISAVDCQIRGGDILSIVNIEHEYNDLLKDFGINDELCSKSKRRYLKDIITSNIDHAEFVSQSNPNQPQLIKSNKVEKDIIHDVIEYNQTSEAELKTIFETAKIIRKSILKYRNQNSLNLSTGIIPTEKDIPCELFSLIKWILGGYKHDFTVCTTKKQSSLEHLSIVNSQNIMYATKTDRQVKYKSEIAHGFRNMKKHENKNIIGRTLQLRQTCRNKKIINTLNKDCLCLSNDRALQIETAMANAVVKTLENTESARNLFPFIQQDKFINFHFDNTDFDIDTQDGKNQLHGGLIVLFQRGVLEKDVLQHIDIDLTASTMKVNSTDVTVLQPYSKPDLKQFTIKKSSSKNCVSSIEATSDLATWKFLTSHESTSSITPPWSGYYSKITNSSSEKTNIGVLPIIPHPVTDWSTVFTALNIMQRISIDVQGYQRLTTISLDLALYEKALQVVQSNNELCNKFNLRLGELHILMAHLRGIGSYIEFSGIENIWIESNVYGPATTRSIISCTHLRRAFQAHEDSLIAFYTVYMNEFYKNNPVIERRYRAIVTSTVDVKELDQKLKMFYYEIENDIKEFNEKYANDDMSKFILNYMHMVERSQEFVYASRTENWQLHLQSSMKLAEDFHSTNRIKYMRLMPYYVHSQYALKSLDPQTWNDLEEGGFTVKKSQIPFTAIGPDHAGEQENKVLKVQGGLRGIANNENARNRFFLVAPVLSQINRNLSETKTLPVHHNLLPSKTSKQRVRVEKIIKTLEDHAKLFCNNNGVLRNIFTNAVVNDQYVYDIINVNAIGAKSLLKFEEERLYTNSQTPLWSPVGKNKINNFKIAMSNTGGKKEVKNPIKMERNLLAKFLVIARSSRTIDEKEMIGNYELCEYPRSLMSNESLLYCNDKSKIASELLKLSEEETNTTITNQEGEVSFNTCLIIDGMAVVQSLVKKPWVKTCNDFAKLFNNKIEYFLKKKKYISIRLLFDFYDPDSLKKSTRNRRNINQSSLYYHVTDTSNISNITFKNFLSNESTKKELTVYLSSKFLQNFKDQNVKLLTVANNVASGNYEIYPKQFNHDEADTLIVWHAVNFSREFKTNANIDIISPDTDVLLICINFSQHLPFHTKMITFSKTYHIGNIANSLGKNKSEALLSLHAITGCDTTGRFASKGKITWLKSFFKLDDNDVIVTKLRDFGNGIELDNDSYEILAQFVSLVYSGNRQELSDARWQLFSKKLAEGEKLPPTMSAFNMHLKRALLQVIYWKSSLDAIMVNLDPIEFGWKKLNEDWFPVPMLNAPIAADVSLIISFGSNTFYPALISVYLFSIYYYNIYSNTVLCVSHNILTIILQHFCFFIKFGFIYLQLLPRLCLF